MIYRTALGTTDTVKFQVRIAQSKTIIDSADQADYLDIGFGKLTAEKLYTELVKLPVPAFLRSLVPEHGTEIEKPRFGSNRSDPVLEVRAYHRCCSFGPKRHDPAGPVTEGVHLLVYDIRLFPHATFEQFHRLESRCADLPVTIERCRFPDSVLNLLPESGPCRQNIIGSFWSFEFHLGGTSLVEFSGLLFGFEPERATFPHIGEKIFLVEGIYLTGFRFFLMDAA
jgi:hypothetical protein